jgi:outer membrane protein OmpA-like peptidoglycan-associated protein
MKQRNKYLKAIIILIALTQGINRLFAQEEPLHEFSAVMGGGISSLQFNLSRGNRSLGWGGLVGLGYHYSWDYHWSAGTGIEFTRLNSRITLPVFEDTYRFADNGQADGTANLYSVEVSGHNYKESQRAYYLQIPLQIRFQEDLWEDHKWYAAIGTKLGFPLGSRYASRGAMETKGWELSATGMPLNADVYTQMPENGFGPYAETSQTGNLNLGFSITASLEAGVKWWVTEDWSLYSGLYLDYGINNIRRRTPENRVFEYNRLSQAFCPYEFHSALSSVHTSGGSTDRPYAERVNTLAIGLKVQLTFGMPVYPPPRDALTADEIEEILRRNVALQVEEQGKEFETMKNLIDRDDPDLTTPVHGFDFDREKILNMMHPELSRKTELLKKYPQAKILLVGHTDDSGNDEYNYRLGLERATAVKDYLIEHGIAAHRLSVDSKGKREPAVPNASESNRRYNRRVEFILQK